MNQAFEVQDSANVDPKEIAHFDRIANLWWDERGKMGNLHVINPLRRAYIFENISIESPKMLDVGCGGGILTEALVRSGAEVTGIDQSTLTLEIARRHAKSEGLSIDYRCQRIEELAVLEPEMYDAICCMEMLEHVPDPNSTIHACAHALKPGGKLFFSTINRSAKAWLFAIIIGEYVLGLLPRGTHQYQKLIRPQELYGWANAAGLDFVSVASLLYNPITRGFKVKAGVEDINYMACFVKRGAEK
ncbi:3-Dimethylubiquinone-9 3-methyltransferase [gamma proteobacterium HdN1]|nr:3-Dimethylubiquinone-9 3-methyltransferase [gamma proteobacterium HdN1]